MEQPGREQVQRMAKAVHDKILSKQALIAETEGELTIRVFRKGPGYDIKLRVTLS